MSNLYTNKKAVRETLADIDYMAKLSPADKAWLRTFIAATADNNTEAQAELAPLPEAFRRLYVNVYTENNARERDITQRHIRVELAGEGGIQELLDAGSEVFAHLRCSRCLSKAPVCTCPARGRNSPYGREDYLQLEESEDTTIAALDVKRRIAAYDLLPYGTSPTNLLNGHTVQICLPAHLFKNAWGVVIDYRATDGKYLIDVKSRRGLRDRDGALPKNITVWVSPTGLRRYPTMIVKERAQ